MMQNIFFLWLRPTTHFKCAVNKCIDHLTERNADNWRPVPNLVSAIFSTRSPVCQVNIDFVLRGCGTDWHPGSRRSRPCRMEEYVSVFSIFAVLISVYAFTPLLILSFCIVIYIHYR